MAKEKKSSKAKKPKKRKFIGLDSFGNTPEFPYVRASASAIHNHGLFAAKRIPEGAHVIQYLGELISKKNSNRRGNKQHDKSQSDNVGSVYIFDLDGKRDLDGNFEWNIARLANHSCEPNCEAQDIEGEIWFVSLRSINKNEELTFDYGYALEHWEEHPCRCGAESCAGYIVREEDRKKLRKKIKRQVEVCA